MIDSWISDVKAVVTVLKFLQLLLVTKTCKTKHVLKSIFAQKIEDTQKTIPNYIFLQIEVSVFGILWGIFLL